MKITAGSAGPSCRAVPVYHRWATAFKNVIEFRDMKEGNGKLNFRLTFSTRNMISFGF